MQNDGSMILNHEVLAPALVVCFAELSHLTCSITRWSGIWVGAGHSRSVPPHSAFASALQV